MANLDLNTEQDNEMQKEMDEYYAAPKESDYLKHEDIIHNLKQNYTVLNLPVLKNREREMYDLDVFENILNSYIGYADPEDIRIMFNYYRLFNFKFLHRNITLLFGGLTAFRKGA